LPGGRPLRFSLIFTGFGGSSSSESDEINGFDLIFDGGGGLGGFVEPFFRPLLFFTGSSTGSYFHYYWCRFPLHQFGRFFK
jgi:hypothetical protein